MNLIYPAYFAKVNEISYINAFCKLLSLDEIKTLGGEVINPENLTADPLKLFYPLAQLFNFCQTNQCITKKQFSCLTNIYKRIASLSGVEVTDHVLDFPRSSKPSYYIIHNNENHYIVKSQISSLTKFAKS